VNKNIIVMGAMAVGLYLLSQASKPKRVLAKKKTAYTKLKPKKAVAKKKKVYNKSKIKKATTNKKVAPKLTKPQKKKSSIKHHIAI